MNENERQEIKLMIKDNLRQELELHRTLLMEERNMFISRINEIGTAITRIEQERVEFKNQMDNYVSDMFKSGSFVAGLKKHLYDFIKQEVSATIKDGDYHAIVGQTIRDKMTQDIKPVVRAMTEEIMSGLRKGLSYDYETVKSCIYSMEKEVQHMIARTGLSLETEELIRQKIGSMLKTIEAKAVLQLEQKNGEFNS